VDITDLAPGPDKFRQEGVTSLEQRLAQAERDINHATIMRLESRLAVKSLALQQMTMLLREAQAHVAAIENSTVWRLTRPLRRSLAPLPGFRRIARGALHFAFLMATGRRVWDPRQYPLEKQSSRRGFSPRALDLQTHAATQLRSWRAPRSAKMGVNLVGPAEFLNGLSTSFRGYLASLQSAGIPTNVIPWREGFEHLEQRAFRSPSIGLQPINLIHLNLDILAVRRLLEHTPLRSLVLPDRYNVAIVSWELTSIPPEHASIIEHLDEVWCASSFTAGALLAVTFRPVRVVRPALDRTRFLGKRTRNDFGLPTDRFVFFYAADVGGVLGRKNPKALLDAYLAEFSEDEGACCVIKISCAHGNNPDIQEFVAASRVRKDVIFLNRILEDDEIADLFSLIDCYVSPHRSEGLGITLIEAMRAGKPVIATPYGGVTDFITKQTAFLLDYQLVEVGEGNAPYPPNFVWADPKHDSLRSTMRAVMENREKAMKVAASGCRHVSEMFGAARTAADINKEIRRIWALGGRHLTEQ
jgi:glycosyltransferase involved in cell wall biosynthesis